MTFMRIRSVLECLFSIGRRSTQCNGAAYVCGFRGRSLSLRRNRFCGALLAAASLCGTAHAHSDGANPQRDANSPAINAAAPGTLIAAAVPDPSIQQALAAVSPAQIEHTIATMAGFHNRNTLSSMDTSLPPHQGATAAADWIESEFRRYSVACGGCLDVRRDTFTEPAHPGAGRIPAPTVISNIYAVLRGSDPAQARRMYLVTGHYDSRGNDVLDTRKAAPGANDDASGVAVSLECARVLSPLHLSATVVFAAVAGEEQGLYGSAHLAQFAHSEGWLLEGVLNNDIVGGDTTPGGTMQDKSAVRVFSEGIPAAASPDQIRAMAAHGGESDSPSRELARAVADAARTYFGGAAKAGAGRQVRSAVPFHPVLEFRPDRFLRGGDHLSFNHEGFAAVRFTEWRENFNHQHQDVRTENGLEYGDLIKFVDFNYVGQVARLNAATLATLAAGPPPPTRVMIVTSALNNDSTLRWDPPQTVEPSGPNRAPAAVSYEVVWRATAMPDWEYSQATAANAITLAVSKDNVIFGVRSVDAGGHRSIAVIPTPER